MFASRYVKHSKLLLRHAQKYLRYKRDILDTETYDLIGADIRRLHAELRQRDRKQIEGRAEELDAKLHQLTPVTWESHWRENCEVILVAIVVAVGIRSYFLQPFKIPTGSMQPTLNGIIGRPMTSEPPNILQQVAEFIVRGRNYINVVSRVDDEVLQFNVRSFSFSSPGRGSSVGTKNTGFIVHLSNWEPTLGYHRESAIDAAKSSPAVRSIRVTRSSWTNLVTTSSSPIAAMYSFFVPKIFPTLAIRLSST